MKNKYKSSRKNTENLVKSLSDNIKKACRIEIKSVCGIDHHGKLYYNIQFCLFLIPGFGDSDHSILVFDTFKELTHWIEDVINDKE